ncbi:hypothetical protein ACFL5A_02625 [Gemmatimonadota bacterium]
MVGLDEWMLRLGHLKVVCSAGIQSGAGRRRIKQKATEILTETLPWSDGPTGALAVYLKRKKLAPELRDESGQFRYPDLGLVEQDGAWDLVSLSKADSGPTPGVTRQDHWFSQEGLRSRTGAISVGGRHGSKTGLDHVLDWAEMTGLMSRSGQILPPGLLLARHRPLCLDLAPHCNPYRFGPEWIIPGFLLIEADIDVFGRFTRALSTVEEPITKKTGARAFARAVLDLADEAEEDRSLTSGQRYAIAGVLRDLQRSVRRTRAQDEETLGAAATTWHRASSRLETYADLGILEKARAEQDFSYEYRYLRTPVFRSLLNSLENATDTQQWLEGDLFPAITGKEEGDQAISDDMLREELPALASTIGRPTMPLPIETVALWMVVRGIEEGLGTSISAARDALRRVARSDSAFIRLSRGSYGEREEFISLRP